MKKSVSSLVWMLIGILFISTGIARAGRFALVADYGNQRVAEFYVSGTTWTYVKDFVNASTAMGSLAPLIHPSSVAQDQQGRIYVSDQGAAGANRILRFDTNGVFIDMVGTNGLNGFNVPGSGIDDMVCGPDGNIYGTLAFGSGNNQILKFDVASTNWSVLYSGAPLSTPRGLDFGPDGNLYVNNRGNARMLVFDTSGGLLRTNATFSGAVATTPMGLRYDPTLSEFICTSGNGNSVICSCPTNGTSATNGTLITAANPTGGPGASKSSLGVLASGTNVFYVPYVTPGHVYLCNNSSSTSVTAVDTGTTPALNLPTFMNFATGFSLGSLQSVTLNVAHTTLIQGISEQAQLLGNYADASGVDITSDPGTAWSSSNPGVVTVSGSGLLSALDVGTATITASNGGQTDTVDITVVPQVTTLIHRYSFTSDASDSVGTANGAIYGYDYAFVNGQIVFTPSSAYDFNYVDFGPNTISSNAAVTFEAWATFGTNTSNARLFDFGNNNGVIASSSVFLTPHSSSGTTRVGMVTSEGGETDVDAPGILDNHTNVQIVAVFDPLAGYIKLYLNGVLAAEETNVTGQDLASVMDQYSYLGLSQNFADPSANESIDEFRIYAGVLDATNVAIDYVAGPTNLVSDPGALQSISVVVNASMLQQGQQAVTVYGDFANVSGVPINDFSGISFVSSDTNVLTVSASGVVKAVGFGTATITVTYGDQSAPYTITSAPLPQASYLVADAGNNRVLDFNAVGTNWTADGTFVSAASGAFALGTNGDTAPLNYPWALAQDAAGNVYVAEGVNGGRVLKFTANGRYLATVGTDGIDFTGIPDAMTFGPDGNLYMSTAFGTNATDHVLKYDVVSDAWSEFVAQSAAPSPGLIAPRGIAFGPDGNLYVCNRGSFGAINQMVQEFDTNGVYVQDLADGLTGPQALSYDAPNHRFIVSVGNTSLDAIDTNGVVTPIATGVGANILDALSVGPNVFYSDYGKSGVYAVTSGGSASALVAGGMTDAGHMLLTQLPSDLSITLSGGNIIVSWPYSLSADQLQSSLSLSPANWQNVETAPTQSGNVMQVTLPMSGNALFFRLSNQKTP